MDCRLRVHGNKKRPPSWTVPSQTVKQVVKFIPNVTEEQALLLPGRVSGFKRTDVRLLPSALTKHRLWMTYTGICTKSRSTKCGLLEILRFSGNNCVHLF